MLLSIVCVVVACTRSAIAAAVVASNLPSPWTSQGCRTEGSGARALAGASYTNSTGMTQESCIAFCSSKSFIYAGGKLLEFRQRCPADSTAEYSSECYCGNFYSAGSTSTSASDCSMPCSGNAAQSCGGSNRLNVFWNGQQAPPPPVVNPGPAGWMSLGCYSDSQTRTLANGVAVPGGASNMTVAGCLAVCQQRSFTYAGTEYSGECYCSNQIASSGKVIPASSCSMICRGNSSEYCGGPNAIDIYTFGTAPSSVPSTSTPRSTTPASTPRTSSGNSVTPSPTSSTPLTPSLVTSSTTIPSASGLPTGWSYNGCWVDNKYGRVLMDWNPNNPNMTIGTCASLCQNSGYSIAGIEYATECYCGNQIVNGGALAKSDSECAMKCGGDSSQTCGGPNRLSVYANSTIQTVGVPVPQTAGLGDWTYQGCWTDNVNGKTLPNQIILANNNSAQSCLGLCKSYGYPVGGMEYGRECCKSNRDLYDRTDQADCGDPSDVTAAQSTKVSESDCSTACTSNASAVCGGGNRLSLYTWTGAPMYTFSYPQGNAAGQYKFFIPGLVVPLITVAGKNGKVTFVEKYGTSQFRNSTGAYELDPFYEGDFNKSWRTMTGIKTDVFCSAGLILPDAGARQINIGGWSGTSTYGVRFYTPDGSPGQPSKNMWEENANEIALQAGRWYPSAMIMSNGSILVVGGEDGSNGKPTPSLELLPRVGGTMYLDYLARTDPNNLYPYLAVLPSGGIFISYFNEARILDPVTLQTIKVLPTQPGQVTNPISGRTYPFEGTAVLLPQHAPYTEPLTVLLCGGSGSGAGVAIDNCISTQPDTANPTWTLERMPSKRVMSCMAALPDGTYLIVNGAMQGVAGFGLASNPNLNAVLYDPTRPVGSRMSVMANTTIARLYHSEAILLDDGRVLISGSDPQDGKHPEEMRVEIFNPPYALSGAAKPTLLVGNTNWAYGAQIQVTISIPSGSPANVRFSLLGAVASTHGNSMGQRTMFPSFSCASNTCTITAPPDNKICPPGWFQLFVLDGPTPGRAVWVRIGGDPGSLGSWPNFPDFTKPGS